MSLRSIFTTSSLFLLLLGGLTCRPVSAVEESPIDREAEALFIEYLRLDTTNPPGNETAGAHFFERLLQKESIPSRLLGEDSQRLSIYARLESGRDAPALLLLHHLDVVPANPAEWSVPPFEGRKAGGYIWGRGALDAKSLGIAHFMAFIDLARKRASLQRDVIFLGVADEETGGMKGMARLLEIHPELFADVGWVLNEGGANETIVDRNVGWGIEIDQKVPLWLRLVARSRGGHGAVPSIDGGSAMKLTRAIVAISDIAAPWTLTPSVKAHMASVGKRRSGLRGEIYRDPSRFFGTPSMAEVPDGAAALMRNTVAVTMLEAGSSVNVIPTVATALLDVRLVPGSDSDEFLNKVREAAGELAEVEVILQARAAPPSPTNTELFRTISAAAIESSPGSAITPFVTAGTSDSRFFRSKGITAYGFSPFKVNYMDGPRSHGIDERIKAKFFSEGVGLMREIVRRAVTRPAP
ncbi:MAG TPA: M20/M25/M40 family metallo-hydrolase [Thermoanaerobaculia bacterium]|nr:M20/M25/M40 family metallo-hydrolase [Thermoanaerobaculia bacterium]